MPKAQTEMITPLLPLVARSLLWVLYRFISNPANFHGSRWIPGSYVSKSSNRDPNNALPRRLTL